MKHLFNKKNILSIILFVLLSSHIVCAGNIIEIDDSMMYQNDFGEIAKDTWVWIDTNNDSIAECYRFDKDGYLAKNYKDRYNKETNGKGQLIENGKVIKKMLSNDEIINGNDTPEGNIIEYIGNIIMQKNNTRIDKWTKKESKIIEYETNGIEETIDGKIIYQKDNTNEVQIIEEEALNNGVIVSNKKTNDSNIEFKNENDIVVGKDFRRFISARSKCTDKVSKVYIFGGTEWRDVLCLNGSGAYVKFLLNKNNYIRFEVANENHGEEMRVTDITLDMYVDGILIDSLDEFADDKPQIVEEYLEEGTKTIELRLNIKSGSKTRKVYIRNGRFKKVKIKD